MDLFGRKRIASLVALDRHRSANIAALKSALREQDQLIYNMSQMESWAMMRPCFQELLAATEVRRRAESDRIADNIISELNKV